MTSAPVFCIWMLAFASCKLRSKFDISNGTRRLGYLYAILTQPVQMKRNCLANLLFNFRDSIASCDTAWEVWHVGRKVFSSLLNEYCVLHGYSEPRRPAYLRILI